MSAIATTPGRSFAISRVKVPAGLLGVYVSLIAAGLMLRPALDPDLGWHLRTGQIILSTHAIPHTDLYSFTRYGATWIEQEWLWQAAMAAVHMITGLIGVVVVSAAVVGVTVWGVYARLRMRHVAPIYAAVGAAVTMVQLAFFSGVRPGMAVGIFSALYLLAFEAYERRRDWRLLAAVVPCQVLWANSHGSWVIGPLLCGVYGVSALWQTRRWPALVPWGALGAALLAATLANPIGLNLIRFTLFASRLPFNRQYTNEWKPPDFRQWYAAPLLLCIVATLLLTPLCREWTSNRRQILLLAGCTLAVLYSQQFLLLYAVAAAPLLGEMVHELRGRRFEPHISAVSAVVLLAATAGLAVSMPRRYLSSSAYEATMSAFYPVNAVAFIARKYPRARMWNEFDWGGYLIGALPHIPVFADGRTEMYGQQFMQQYIRVAQAEDPPDPVLDRYGINLALLSVDSPLATELRQKPAWREAYKDRVASVFVRIDG